jgi:hypothetical protein
MTAGLQRLLDHGQRSSTSQGSRTVYKTTGQPEQQTLPPTPQRPQYLQKDYWLGLIRQRTKQEYTAARGQLDHATLSGAGRRVSLMLGIRS